MKKFELWVVVLTLVAGAGCHSADKPLPMMGRGTIPFFTFVDQDSNQVSSQSLNDKIYVADFIFLSCPSICPKLTHQMQRVYAQYTDDNRIVLLSHSIDPKRDTVARLRKYARGLGVRSDRWHFLTGNEDTIMNLAEHGYYTMAYPDSTAPGGFAHGGGFLLVDRNKHIRGVYNAIDSTETDRLIKDIRTLLKEEF
jgi:protein SCO1/2